MTKEEKILRGYAVDEMMTTNGWRYTKEYIEKQKSLAETSLLNGGFSNIEEYNLKLNEYQFYTNFLKELERWVKEARELDRDNG